MSDNAAESLAQHEALHRIMRRCEHLADELDEAGGSSLRLLHEVVRLRGAFERHNRADQHTDQRTGHHTGPRALPPLARGASSGRAEHRDPPLAELVRIEPIVGDPLAMGPTAELRAAIAALREHLVTEAHHLRSTRGLRDDVVYVEPRRSQA